MTLRRRILDFLSKHSDRRLSIIQREFSEWGTRVRPQELLEELWLMVGQGVVYIDVTQSDSGNWDWNLTHKGRSVLKDEEAYAPDDPQQYIERLKSRLPDVDPDIVRYLTDALRAYEARADTAASVMLGVASEKAFLLLAGAFCAWLPETEGGDVRAILENDRSHFIYKFREFRKRLEPKKRQLPPEFVDNMTLTLDSVSELLRASRNEAGHPTGRIIEHSEVYSNLQVFSRYLEKLYVLKRHFEEGREK